MLTFAQTKGDSLARVPDEFGGHLDLLTDVAVVQSDQESARGIRQGPG